MSLYWLGATGALALGCLIFVLLMVKRLIDVQRSSLLASVPLVAEQEIALDATGPMLLHGEGLRFTRAFGGLEYRLIGLSDNRDVPLNGIWLKSSSSGVSKARLSLRSFDLARAGHFRLTVRGAIDPALADEHKIVITHNRRNRIVGIILGLVFGGIGIAAGLALSILVVSFSRSGV